MPHPSAAVTVTVVTPTGNTLPEAGTDVIVIAPGQLSVAVGVKLTAAPHRPGVLLTVILAGQVNTGAVPSILVLYVTAVALPQPSVVVTVITALQVPTVDATSVNAPGQLSVADVAAKAAASAAATVA